MKKPKSILLFAFEPFLGYKNNSSLQVARNIMERASPREVNYIELPVVFGDAARKVTAVMRETNPDYVLGLGQNAAAKKIAIERLALNVNHTLFRDNAGNKPFAESIVSGRTIAYWTTLPYKRIIAVFRENSIPFRLSYFAGTYVCNNVLFSLLDARKKDRGQTGVGFLHLPRVRTKKKGKLSLEYLSMVVEKALCALSSGE